MKNSTLFALLILLSGFSIGWGVSFKYHFDDYFPQSATCTDTLYIHSWWMPFTELYSNVDSVVWTSQIMSRDTIRMKTPGFVSAIRIGNGPWNTYIFSDKFIVEESIDYEGRWCLKVHSTFSWEKHPDLAKKLKYMDGINHAYSIYKYELVLFPGKAFDLEDVKRRIISTINEYLYTKSL